MAGTTKFVGSAETTAQPHQEVLLVSTKFYKDCYIHVTLELSFVPARLGWGQVLR